MLICRSCWLLCIGLSSLHLAFASLPSAEVEALREMFQVAYLPWEGKDPCALRQVGCDNHTVSTVSHLFFPRLNITSLPESIGQLKSLEVLVLNDNLLTEIPPVIWKLQLKLLDLSGNWLTSLPDAVEQLQSLKFLLLRSNQLVSLPDSIGQLRSLSDLDLRNNNLTRLPDSIGQMESL